MCYIECSIFNPLNLYFNFRLNTPFLPNRTLFDIKTAFLLKTQFIARGWANILGGQILRRKGEGEPFLV